MSRLNMDHPGGTGGHIEIDGDGEIEGEFVDTEVADTEVAEVEHDEAELAIEYDEVEHEVAGQGAVEERRAGSRYRHPAAAAALAKRVAMDRSARIAVASLVAVAMMFLFVFPTRSYLAQRGQVRDARHAVQVLREQNEELAREAQRLQSDRAIERLARSQFNMVFEGEEAYNVVPPRGTATTTTPP